MNAQWLFPAVTSETVDKTIKWTAYAWYGVAVLQAVFVIRSLVHGSWAGGDLVGPVVAYIGAHALLVRKSRAAAAALIFYAGLTLLFAIGALLGLAGNGASIIVSLLALYAAWRAWEATLYWQKRRCAQVHWGRVWLASTLATLATLAALLLAWSIKIDLPDFHALASFLFAAAAFLPGIAVIWHFTRRWPFAGTDPACPWPKRA